MIALSAFLIVAAHYSSDQDGKLILYVFGALMLLCAFVSKGPVE